MTNVYDYSGEEYKDDVYDLGYQDGSKDMLNKVIKLFEEMRPEMATHVCEFAHKLYEMREEHQR